MRTLKNPPRRHSSSHLRRTGLFLIFSGVALSLFSIPLSAQDQPPASAPELPLPAAIDDEPTVNTQSPPPMQLDTDTTNSPETPLIQEPQAPEYNPDSSGLLAPRMAEPAVRPIDLPVDHPLEQPQPEASAAPALQPDAQIKLRADPFERASVQGSQTTGETLTDGVGKRPNPLGAGFLESSAAATGGFPVGPFTIRPIISTGVNFRSQDTDDGGTENEVLFSVFGTLSAVLGEPATGNVLSANYSGNLFIGDNRTDPYDQSLEIRGSLSFTKLKLGMGIHFAQLTGTNRDFGGDTNRELFTVSLTSSYQYSEKTWFDWDITLPVRHFEDGQSSFEVTSTNTVNFAYSPKTTVGGGFTVGTLALDKGNTQKFGQIFGRVQFSPSEFLSTEASLGIEERDTGGSTSASPVFAANATWRPRLGTAFALTGERRIQNSAAVEDTNYTSTSVVLSVTQRLGESFSIQASGGVEDAVYDSNLSNGSISRHDDYYLGQINLTDQINPRWIATLQVSCGYNDSSNDSIRLVQSSLFFSYIF